MTLHPSSKEDLAAALRQAHQLGAPIATVDLSALNVRVEHTPEDMTATVEAGVTLGALQSRLAERGQWLPIDPPNAERLTIAGLVATNASGPRRFGFGTIRDHLIGLEVILADGRLIHSGGKVVKNVAGFDLMKLFVGGQESLGFIVEATFKLLPVPEAEQCVQARCASLTEAGRLIDAVLESELTPTVLDLHHGLSGDDPDRRPSLLLAFAGPREDVAWQLEKAHALGIAEPASIDDEKPFWAIPGDPPTRLSVLPSRVIETLRGLGEGPFVARAGNGVIHHRGAGPSPPSDLPLALLQRVKATFDPGNILPGLPTR
jgi:glycolate oxidase FAD binding subunit